MNKYFIRDEKYEIQLTNGQTAQSGNTQNNGKEGWIYTHIDNGGNDITENIRYFLMIHALV